MRYAAVCAGIAIGLVASIVALGLQQNVVLLWAAVTTIVATSVR